MRRHTRLFLGLFWILALGIAVHPVAYATCETPRHTVYLPRIQASDPPVEQTVGNYYIVQPQTTTNLITNPSFETATTNWTANGGSIARSTTYQRRGVYSLAYTPSSTTTAGVYFGTISTTNGTSYTFSVDVLGVSGVPYQIYFANTSGTLLGTATTFTGTGAWQRVEVTYAETSSTTRRVYVAKNSSADTGIVYIDGAQVEALAYSTTYCDGDITGCVWSGTKHASSSTRASNVRSGGRKINLDTLSAYLISQQGTGMAPVVTHMQPYAAIDGAFFQSQRVGERTITIALSVAGDGTASWHSRRQALINLIKPDLVHPQQPFRIIYDGGGKDVYLDCFYDGGLEIADGIRDIEAIPVRCRSANPYWFFDGEAGAALTVQQTVSNANYIVQRRQGLWQALSTGMSGGLAPFVDALVYDSDGGIIAGGSFTDAGGSGADYIAKWNGSAWSALSSATALGNEVYALTRGPDGSVYVGGAFDNAGGVGNADRIAKWDGSSWSAVGSGANGNVRAIAVGVDGSIYAGGNFTSIGGTAANYIAKWDGSAWSALGTGMAGGSPGTVVDSITIGSDGSVYAGGAFATAGGTTVNNIAKWNGSAWSALGSGTNGEVRSVVFGLDNMMYIGGLFTTASGITVNYVARWNGSAWSPLGSGFTESPTTPNVVSLAVDATGLLYASGDFTASGAVSFPDRTAVWNGSVWVPLDIDLPGTNARVDTILIGPTGDITLGTEGSGSAVSSALTTVTNNGSSIAYPVVKVKGPSSGSAQIYQIANITTNTFVYLDYSILSGETVTLTFTPGGIKASSDFRGNIPYIVYPGSKMTKFNLLPGQNSISLYVSSSSATATITWPEQCWSIDSSASS